MIAEDSTKAQRMVEKQMVEATSEAVVILIAKKGCGKVCSHNRVIIFEGRIWFRGGFKLSDH